MSTDNQDANAENKISYGCWTCIPEWVKANWLWIAAHIINLWWVHDSFFSGSGIPILPVVIFMCIIFVQIYTDPISPVPIEADKAEREQLEKIRSEQRNKWMKFAYSFMLLSLLLTFYPFINPLFNSTEKTQSESGEQKKATTDINPKPGSNEKIRARSGETALNESAQKKIKPDERPYLDTLRERPIAVFIGCSLDSKTENLRCRPKDSEKDQDKSQETSPAAEGDKNAQNKAATKLESDKKDQSQTASQKENDTKNQTQQTSSKGVGYAWVINIGGYIKQCNQDDTDNDKYGKSITCEVKDGLLIPLYFIIMALMGGSISLTRRLPELQKQAGSEHIATAKQPRLSQYEFREHLIFQMVQFISAPFLAILAYYLIEPSNTTNAVVLAFTAGFASETILLMVRSVANKITPETSAGPQYGAIAGIVLFEAEDDRKNVEKDRKKMEVFLTELPHQAHSIVDQGLYTLSNVLVGEHSISVKFIDSEKIIKKDIVKVAHAQAIFNKNITITKQEMEKAQ
ncbi:hypothetical protein [Nitrosomonas sp.]|uniref:hypothetical protein n=1 Tax=Nitrosomonas sp. TaxID=42353 RepID=UPI002717FB95|nr:hypothetical protein [Nitrosomonas sp.]MDO8894501.1 hypothetical protein [Nitrosomonas sp.]